MRKKLTHILLLFSIISFTSCGTFTSLFDGGKRPLYLMQAPRDIQVLVGRQQMPLGNDAFDRVTSATGVSITYHSKSVRLSYKKDIDIILYSPSLKKRDTVTLTSKPSAWFILPDILFTAGIGLLIDYKTKDHCLLTPRYIDVKSALEGKPISEWRNKKELIAKEKKGADKQYHSH